MRKSNASTVPTFLDNKFQHLYQCVVPSDFQFDHISIPWRAHIQAAQAVGSYANVLIGMSNPQEETTNNNLDRNKVRPRKCAAAALDTSCTQVTPNS
eukprot:10492922-Ditylum_brightwellii.AAC.1